MRRARADSPEKILSRSFSLTIAHCRGFSSCLPFSSLGSGTMQSRSASLDEPGHVWVSRSKFLRDLCRRATRHRTTRRRRTAYWWRTARLLLRAQNIVKQPERCADDTQHRGQTSFQAVELSTAPATRSEHGRSPHWRSTLRWRTHRRRAHRRCTYRRSAHRRRARRRCTGGWLTGSRPAQLGHAGRRRRHALCRSNLDRHRHGWAQRAGHGLHVGRSLQGPCNNEQNGNGQNRSDTLSGHKALL